MVTFVNAQEMHKKHPDTFDAPSPEELAAIQPGMFVKVCGNQKERFWIKVIRTTKRTITGEVANSLLELPLSLGERVRVQKSAVYDIIA